MTTIKIKSWKENGQIKLEFGGGNFSRAEIYSAFLGIEKELNSSLKYSGLNSDYSGNLIINAILPNKEPWETIVQIQNSGFSIDEINAVVNAAKKGYENHFNSLNTIGNPKPSKELNNIAFSFHFILSMIARTSKSDLVKEELEVVLKNISKNNYRQIEEGLLISEVYRAKMGLLSNNWQFTLYHIKTEQYNQWLELAFFKNVEEKLTKLVLMISEPEVVSAIKNEVFPSLQKAAPWFTYLTENNFVDAIGKNKCTLLENYDGNNSIFLFSNN